MQEAQTDTAADPTLEHNETAGNAAYQESRALLAQVQAQARKGHG